MFAYHDSIRTQNELWKKSRGKHDACARCFDAEQCSHAWSITSFVWKKIITVKTTIDINFESNWEKYNSVLAGVLDFFFHVFISFYKVLFYFSFLLIASSYVKPYTQTIACTYKVSVGPYSVRRYLGYLALKMYFNIVPISKYLAVWDYWADLLYLKIEHRLKHG